MTIRPAVTLFPNTRAILPVLHELRDKGRLTELALIDPQLLTCKPSTPRELPPDHQPGEVYGGWQDLARNLSMRLGGQFRATATGVSWNNGGVGLWLCGPKAVEGIFDARTAVYQLTGVSALPFSTAGLSRVLLAWSQIEEKNHRAADELRRGVSHHYQFCFPSQVPRAALYDVKGCYASILDRMPSPLVHLAPEGRIIFERLEPWKLRRWEAVKTAAAEHKLLRNCIVGNMTGGSKMGHYWCKGEKRISRPVRGPLRPAGLLVARTAWELLAEVVERAQQVSALHAIYGSCDSVALLERDQQEELINSEILSPWRRYGLEVRKLAEGEAEFCGLGVYRVGEKQTKWYSYGCRGSDETKPAILTTVGGPVYARWLDNVRYKKQ